MKKDTELHLDTNGNIDTDYYIHKARVLRSEHLKELLIGFKQKLNVLFHFELPTIKTDRPAHH